MDDCNLLRFVRLDGTLYTLRTWDTHKRDQMGKHRLGYSFAHDEDGVIFIGEDFYASPLHAIDSDAVLRSILCFLTLGKGDTDAEYFEGYDATQLAFRDGPDREHLSLWSMDDDEAENYTFEEVE